MVIDGSMGLDVCGCVDVCILTWVLGLYFDISVVCTLMVLLNLICISFLSVCSSCLCVFFIFVNCEKLVPYFNLIFLYLFFFFFLVLGGERHKMGVKRLIYPSFLRDVSNRD